MGTLDWTVDVADERPVVTVGLVGLVVGLCNTVGDIDEVLVEAELLYQRAERLQYCVDAL